MAKDIYIGVENLAKEVKKLYVGVDNKARKVQYGYTGVENKARLFFADGYLWNRYSNNEIVDNYVWDKHEAVKYKIKYVNQSQVTLPIHSLVYASYTLLADGNVQLNNPESITDRNYSKFKDYWYTSNSTLYGFELRQITTNPTYSSENSQFYFTIARYNIVSSSSATKGIFLNQVFSTSSSTYPKNGVKNDYWYVSTTPTYKDIQGSFITTVETDFPTAYQIGVKNSDGYWYTKNGW